MNQNLGSPAGDPGTDPGRTGDAKRRLRAAFLARRDALDPQRIAAWSITACARAQARIAARRARTIFCYIATAREVGTRALIDALLGAGHTVLVPRLLDRTTMIAAAFPGWDALVPGPLGIPAPPSREAHAAPVDFVLTPGIAFGLDGSRLGFGAGYYDRWFAAHPRACRVALAFECQLTAPLPTCDHDVAVDGIITECRSIAFRRAGTVVSTDYSN